MMAVSNDVVGVQKLFLGRGLRSWKKLCAFGGVVVNATKRVSVIPNSKKRTFIGFKA